MCWVIFVARCVAESAGVEEGGHVAARGGGGGG